MKSEFENVQKEYGSTTRYLGDAVYASFDGYQIWLCTANGIEITNRIALEPAVWQELLSYRKEIGADEGI